MNASDVILSCLLIFPGWSPAEKESLSQLCELGDFTARIVIREIGIPKKEPRGFEFREWSGGREEISNFDKWLKTYNFVVDEMGTIGPLYSTLPSYNIWIYEKGVIKRRYFCTISPDSDSEDGAVTVKSLLELFSHFPKKEGIRLFRYLDPLPLRAIP